MLRRERTEFLVKYFASHPCTDCGENDPVVLDFDHLDPEAKCFDISQGLAYRSWQSIHDEIAKCEVVCANCHRRRTAQRRGTLRLLYSAAGYDPGRAGGRN
jgi:HNH endonuclease